MHFLSRNKKRKSFIGKKTLWEARGEKRPPLGSERKESLPLKGKKGGDIAQYAWKGKKKGKALISSTLGGGEEEFPHSFPPAGEDCRPPWPTRKEGKKKGGGSAIYVRRTKRKKGRAPFPDRRGGREG